MFRKILVPVDLAHPSSWKHALPEAVEMARSSGGNVTLVTVVRELKAIFEGVSLSIQMEALFDKATREIRNVAASQAASEIEIRTVVRCGSIGHEILAVADEIGADLILLSSHRPEMRDYLIGPNAAHVARHAKSSVLVLRRQ
jgi:nucleotide-binding universal stress UspA family protein